jgi:hypothetical protein
VAVLSSALLWKVLATAKRYRVRLFLSGIIRGPLKCHLQFLLDKEWTGGSRLYFDGGKEIGGRKRENWEVGREDCSVGDPDQEPDPDPHDPHVFGPPGSGSISQM